MERTTTLERRTEAEVGLRDPGRGRWMARALQLVGAALVVSSVIVAVFSSHAGATGLSNGTVTLKTSSGSTATSPLADQQVVHVSVGPNSSLSQSSLKAAGFPDGVVAMRVLECADPNGQVASLPQELTSCVPSSLDVGPGPQADGSVSIDDFTVYSAPDPAVLGPSNGTVCDASHQCVVGIFSNQEDFSKPHLFSAPFLVTPASSTAATSNSPGGGNGASSTNPSGASSSNSASGGASAAVSVSPATLANTGAPSLWPWLLGAGCILLLLGSGFRYLRRPTQEGRP
jgi:hypothetical protein